MSDSTATEFDALLLVGHGTRDPAGLAEFWQLVELVRQQQSEWLVEGCFLELAEPTIAAGLARVAQQGARHVRAVPLVLFAAGHAKRDIPQALAAAAAEYPHLTVEQTPHLGCQEAIVELSERRFRQAVGDQDMAAAEETLLLLIGRGSNDAEATQEMHEFATCRRARNPALNVRVAFIAMAQPRLVDELAAAAASAYVRCVVQPHLLFSGLLLSELQTKVERVARQAPGKQWIVADHLGPDIRLATAVAEIARQKIAAGGCQA